MGHHNNPPTKVIEIGHKLEFDGTATYEKLVGLLASNEELYLLAQRLDMGFRNCVHLYSAGEFDEFWRQVLNGNIRAEGFYAVPMDNGNSPYTQSRPMKL